MKDVPEIEDKYVINSGVFYLLGIMVVVPFQFYINSLDFWMYKFKPPEKGPPPPQLSRPIDITQYAHDMRNNYIQRPATYNNLNKYLFVKENETWDSPTITRSIYEQVASNFNNDSTSPDERTPIQANFTAGFTIIFNVTLLGALLICLFWTKKLPPPEKRLKWSLFALCILFFISTLATQINSKQMIQWFFAGALLSASLLNFCTGMAMASLYELISKFPPSYYASILSGHNVCGVISSILQVCLLSARLVPTVTGLIYFACGTIILIVTTIYYTYTIKNSKFFIYKIGQSEQQRKHSNLKFTPKTPLSKIILKIKWYYATIIFVSGTTHIVYPGLVALVVPYKPDSQDIWKEIFFVPVITFLGFQVCNLVGREASRIIKTPKEGMVLFILAVLRIILVPLLIFCNAQPRNKLPVLFQDNEFISILALLAFSDGILMNMAIVAIPTMLKKDEREAVMVLVPLISTVPVVLASGLNVFITNLI